MNKLYLISQDLITGYATYDSAVVSAPSKKYARDMHPSGGLLSNKEKPYRNFVWVDEGDMQEVQADYLGETKEPTGVILSSFNAG